MTLEAGMTKGVTVETAALHSLNEGGEFSVFAKGLLPYAEANSTELSGHIAYESNKLTISVDGKLAARVAKAAIKRSTVGGTCSGSKQSSVQTALSNCNKLASAASGAAQAGTKLSTYFKSSSSATKNTVANRLKAVAADCSNGKATTSNCNDEYNGCAANVLAYTQPSKNSVYYCEIFFSKLPALATTCHGQDQATTVLHEETHNPAVYAPGTDDIGYGYDAAIKLSTSQALSNADSYAIYANGESFSSVRR
jgi:deuterolysin